MTTSTPTIVAPKRAWPVVYRIVWMLGLPNAGLEFMAMQYNKHGDPFSFQNILASLYCGSTACLLWLVYSDMEIIDERGRDPDYPNWAGHGLERGVRIGIIVALLFGVGELTNVAYPYLHAEFGVGESPTWLLGLLWPANPAHSIFVKGSFLAFGLIAIWNFAALRCRWIAFADLIKGKTISGVSRELVISIRIGVFLVLSIICAGYWLSIWVFHKISDDTAKLCVAFYLFFAVCVFALRWRTTSTGLQNLITRAIRSFRKIRDDDEDMPPKKPRTEARAGQTGIPKSNHPPKRRPGLIPLGRSHT